MHRLLVQLLRDDAGFVISGELVLVATIGVLSLVVGLSELSSAVSGNVFNLGAAFSRLNQPCHAQVPGSCNSGCNSQGNQDCPGDMGSSPPQDES